MAVGNAIGSNIFNILMVLGIASATQSFIAQSIGENIIEYCCISRIFYRCMVFWSKQKGADFKNRRNHNDLLVFML